MRISDWSSDVCSSDLKQAEEKFTHPLAHPLHYDRATRPHGGKSWAREAMLLCCIKATLSLAARKGLTTYEPRKIHRPRQRLPAGGADDRDPHEPSADRPRTYRQGAARRQRSEEHTSELQSLMRISYAVFCLQKKKEAKNKIYTYKQSIQ